MIPSSRNQRRPTSPRIRVLHLAATLLAAVMQAAHPVSAGELEQCRTLRHRDQTAALQVCERALAAAMRADDRFELRMHLAELATNAGDWAAADRHLAAASGDIGHVADPLASHRLSRRHGLLAYRRGDSARAMGAFMEARDAARRIEDRRAEAISENDLGTVFRQLGADREALSHWLHSLQLKRQVGDEDLAATYGNLGLLYLDLGEVDRAEQFLLQAVNEHQIRGRTLQVAHSREALAKLAATRGDADAARTMLEDVWSRFQVATVPRDQLRVAQQLVRLALDQQRHDSAQHWLQQARMLLDADPVPLELVLLEARYLRERGDPAAALRLLRSQQPWPSASTASQQVEAWREMSASAAASAQPEAALGYLRSAEQAAAQLADQRHSERMNALRVRFELAELERERARLQIENSAQQLLLETRRRQLLSLGIATLLLLSALVLWFQRRMFRQRLALQQRESEQRARADRAIRDADALRADLRSVQHALDETARALLVVDAAGRIRSANQAAAERLQIPFSQLLGHSLPELFGEPSARLLVEAQQKRADAVECAGDDDSMAGETVAVECPVGRLQVRVLSLALEEDLGVLALEAPPDTDRWVQQLNRQQAAPGSVSAGEQTDESPAEFRVNVVALMRVCLELWERQTRSTRIELAERSGIWRVVVDDGRLRTRTLDRYLAVETLPTRPRWREVVRTTYFVLAECPLDDAQRNRLESALQALLAATDRR